MFCKEALKNFLIENKDMPHTSKYHAETYIQHVLCMVEKAISIQPNNRALIVAVYCHDIGKPACHRFIEGKDNTFYNHEAKGADMLSTFVTTDDPDYAQIEFLVRNHMVPFQAKGPEPWASYAQKQIAQFASEYPAKWLANLFTLNMLDSEKNPGTRDEEELIEKYL